MIKRENMQPEVVKKPFFGWAIVVASVITFGIAVGLPYYNLPFFYDYFQKAYGWRLDQITMGFPLAALLTIWVGPLLIPRFSPRKLILVGTAFTAVARSGFIFSSTSSTRSAICFQGRYRTRSWFPTGSRKCAAGPWGSSTSAWG
jgi:nitrate/nitrite transporter NarK